MNKIIEHIKEKYSPQVIIVYGSFSNETNNLNSDFDALVIANIDKKIHDTSFYMQIQLDVFVYPLSYFEKDVDYDEIIQIFDGSVVCDTNGKGQKLKDNVNSYILSLPKMSNEELTNELAWCKKMLERTKRNDAEGMFRWHWLLTESLQIYCDIKHIYYFGPKKMIIWMQTNDLMSYELYSNALSQFDAETLEAWIKRMEDINGVS